MPTIEIVSLERISPLKIPQDIYPFQIWQSTKIISHRFLFRDFLKDKKGVILHLANQECRKTGFWIASTLIDHNWIGSSEPENERYFRFNKESENGIRDLIDRACRLSPINNAYFLTDYQFGEKPDNLFIKADIESFWILHDKNGLSWNTLYEISI